MKITNLHRRIAYRWATRSIPRVGFSVTDLRELGFKSQYGQDQFVVERLRGMTGGVFLDIGAFDGLTLSNTWYLEKQLGWSGVAIEPAPKAYARCKDNRDCTVLNGCITNSAGRVTFLEIEGPAAMLSGIVSVYTSKHIQRIKQEIEEYGGAMKEISVPCFTVNEVLHANGFDHADYLSIDTEGGELDILKSINFEAMRAKIVTVENNYSDLRLQSYMRQVGYKLIAIATSDEIYEKL